jgi:hypothetical protein
MESRKNNPLYRNWIKADKDANEAEVKSTESMSTESMSTESTINQSGNSDVDVNVLVEVDTMPIALAILCQAFIKKELTNQQLESAVNKLLDLTDKYRDKKRGKSSSSDVLYLNNNIWRR